MPMLLKSDDGKEFELALIADRLPETQDGFGDDETAQVSFRVATEDLEWEETSPVLSPQELSGLAEWLEAVSRGGDAGEAELDLLGPELNFKVIKRTPTRVHLRIAFVLADRPEEFDVDAETTEAKHIDLVVEPEHLAMASATLRADLARVLDSTKDDTLGAEDFGMVASPDATLGIIDRVAEAPPGAGDGEDNAGER